MLSEMHLYSSFLPFTQGRAFQAEFDANSRLLNPLCRDLKYSVSKLTNYCLIGWNIKNHSVWYPSTVRFLKVLVIIALVTCNPYKINLYAHSTCD